MAGNVDKSSTFQPLGWRLSETKQPLHHPYRKKQIHEYNCKDLCAKKRGFDFKLTPRRVIGYGWVYQYKRQASRFRFRFLERWSHWCYIGISTVVRDFYRENILFRACTTEDSLCILYCRKFKSFLTITSWLWQLAWRISHKAKTGNVVLREHAWNIVINNPPTFRF